MYQKEKNKIDISFWTNYIKRGPDYKEDKPYINSIIWKIGLKNGNVNILPKV